MPKVQVDMSGRQRMILDARPDRIDFKDRSYQPPLRSLPAQYPEADQIDDYFGHYVQDGMVLDQGEEGACVGFGLAAMINYLNWRTYKLAELAGETPPEKPKRVSPRMLYDNARLYDEWEGEDYSGSSCRGGMKGWHRHGVCSEDLFRYEPGTFHRPSPDFLEDAAQRPLGSYYRIEHRSIADMQAAIHEVGAVFASAAVHAGWWSRHVEKVTSDVTDAVIIQGNQSTNGGHAFAIVGYCQEGFYIQNSWGEDWGYKGFGILPYDDWVRNGWDAWVAAIGAPTRVYRINSDTNGNPHSVVSIPRAIGRLVGRTQVAMPWTDLEALRHSIVTGNDGALLRRLPGAKDAEDNLRYVMDEVIRPALKNGRKLAIYVHGGINGEEAGIRRATALGPWLQANGIEPLFIIWKTGLLESLGYIAEDLANRVLKEIGILRSRGIGERIIKTLKDRRDMTFEQLARRLGARAIWVQIKQNAEASAMHSGGLKLLSRYIREFCDDEEIPDFKVHLIGHSAGSILIGHMIRDFAETLVHRKDQLEGLVGTLSLYAPACTVPFANKHFGQFGFEKGSIGQNAMMIHNLTDGLERDDFVRNENVYSKSVLYLVSRALEDDHKTPILGMEKSWGEHAKKALEEDFYLDKFKDDLETWDKYTRDYKVSVQHYDKRETLVRRDPEAYIPTAHGSFDNDIEIVENSVQRILGVTALKAPIMDLSVD